MKRIVLVLIMGVLTVTSMAWAEEPAKKGFDFGLSEKMEVKDSQKYLRPFRGGETLLGTGGCYGPFFSLSYGERWLADFLSVCALGAVSQTGEETATLGGDLINLLGLQAGIQYDPKNDKPFYTFGISLTGLANQLLK